jgi:hypothetical protein
MYKEMAAHESMRNTKLSDKKRLTRDEVDGIRIDRHNRFFTYMRVQLSTTFLRSVLRTWVGKSNVVLGVRDGLHRSIGGCVTLHAVGSYRGPAP